MFHFVQDFTISNPLLPFCLYSDMLNTHLKHGGIILKENIKITVSEHTALMPFLIENLKKQSRNNIKSLLSRGQVFVDGVCEKHYAKKLKPNQSVEIRVNASSKINNIGFPVIFEDEYIIVIEKPHGMLSISTEKEYEKTAYHIINNYVKISNPMNRIFIVHRLDRETSGIMLFAKNAEIKNKLQNNWDDTVLHRGYTAVVEGALEKSQGQIVSWLNQTKNFIVYSSYKKDDGKKAVTNYEVVQSNSKFTLLNINLETGRKNQIRVHMKDLGNPVTGDTKYGAKSNPLGRMGLHASHLSIIHPHSGDKIDFRSEPPVSFLKVTGKAINGVGI